MSKIIQSLACSIILVAGLSAVAYAQQLIVTSASNRGAGTLRQAFSLASAGQIDGIVVATERDIRLTNGLTYFGSQALSSWQRSNNCG